LAKPKKGEMTLTVTAWM